VCVKITVLWDVMLHSLQKPAALILRVDDYAACEKVGEK
jgi:hypothetical protein